MPMLPAERRRRLADAAGVGADRRRASSSPSTAASTTSRVAAIEAGGDPARVLVHVEHNLAVDGAEPAAAGARSPRSRALEVGGKLTATQAKAVLAELVAAGGDADPAAIAAAKGFEAMDTGALDAAVDEAIAANPPVWERYLARRGQGGRRARRRGDEGDQGPGRRQGRHRRPPRPPRLLTRCPVPQPRVADVTFATFDTKRLRFTIARRTVLETTLSRIER